MNSKLYDFDPYSVQAGPQLDALVSEKIMGSARADAPRFSTDDTEANRLKAAIKSKYGVKISWGKTHLRRRAWFASYGSDPSTSTEVLAETYPLAICRIALVLAVSRA